MGPSAPEICPRNALMMVPRRRFAMVQTQDSVQLMSACFDALAGGLLPGVARARGRDEVCAVEVLPLRVGVTAERGGGAQPDIAVPPHRGVHHEVRRRDGAAEGPAAALAAVDARAELQRNRPLDRDAHVGGDAVGVGEAEGERVGGQRDVDAAVARRADPRTAHREVLRRARDGDAGADEASEQTRRDGLHPGQARLRQTNLRRAGDAGLGGEGVSAGDRLQRAAATPRASSARAPRDEQYDKQPVDPMDEVAHDTFRATDAGPSK